MSASLFSPSWYRVAELRPRLRNHTRIHRHVYRGSIWHVLMDLAAGRSHRFTPAAYRFIGLMDGRRTVQELWETVGDQLGDEAPTQDEVIRLLGQLHSADALVCDVPPDGRELFRRYQRQRRLEWRRRLWTPLAVRFPLLDPDRFLGWTLPLVRPLLGGWGLALWLVVVGAAAILAGVHWTELTEDVVDRALTPQNLLLLWIVYPLVKALHELGHGYAVKRWGGEVHDMGIMLLVLVPVPYVDASAAWGFRSKHRRMAVGAAGIMVELFLSSVALLVWLNAEQGAVSAIAYNVMLIGGVSTLFFNGNPLLRFDGYYVLADLLEIPNLGTRANRYLGYLAQRYAFRVDDAQSPAASGWERFWFTTYGLAAFAYRMMIMFVIILYIAGKFFTVGVALAAWAVFTQAVVPIGKGVKFLADSPKLREQRGRAVLVTLLVLAVLGGLLFAAPLPLWTRAEGVTWPSDQSQVRAGTAGFVRRVLAADGDRVRPGDPILEADEPFLDARIAVLEARLRELEARLVAVAHTDRVQASVVREEMAAVRADLARHRERARALVVRAPAAGRLVLPAAGDLPGRFVRQGQVVGYVVDPAHLTARVAVSQDEIGLVRERTLGVEALVDDWDAEPSPVRVLREIPGGTNELPTPALGAAGGGSFAVDPRDRGGRTTLERVFVLEVELPPAGDLAYLGSRIHVRFDHGYEPAGFQLYRALRQLFLRRFGV